jgi:hypothetical protein
MIRGFFGILIAAAVYAAGVWCIFAWFENQLIEEFTKQSAIIVEYQPRLEEALEHLNDVAFFQISRGDSDAKDYLVEVFSNDENVFFKSMKSHFSADLNLDLNALVVNDDFDWNAIDLSWMRDLMQFNNLHIYKYESLLDRESGEEQVPQLIFYFSQATRTRLVQGFNLGQEKQAIQEVIHLARLAMTSADELHMMVAIWMLHTVHEFIGIVHAKHRKDYSALLPVTEEDLHQLDWILWGYNGSLGLQAPIDWLEKAPTLASSPALQCVAIKSAIISAATLAPYLEPEYAEHYYIYRQLFEQWKTPCQMGDIGSFSSVHEIFEEEMRKRVVEKSDSWDPTILIPEFILQDIKRRFVGLSAYTTLGPYVVNLPPPDRTH